MKGAFLANEEVRQRWFVEGSLHRSGQRRSHCSSAWLPLSGARVQSDHPHPGPPLQVNRAGPSRTRRHSRMAR